MSSLAALIRLFLFRSHDFEGQDSRSVVADKRKSQDQSNSAAKKRYKTNIGPPTEAMDHEVLYALETWSDAMQEASGMLDKYAMPTSIHLLKSLQTH